MRLRLSNRRSQSRSVKPCDANVIILNHAAEHGRKLRAKEARVIEVETLVIEWSLLLNLI
jgi:hypothetical protein